MSILRNWHLASVDLLGMTLHTPLDQSSKQILRQFYQQAGAFTAEEEVTWDPQRTDGRFLPDPGRLWALPDSLLVRMGQQACTFEVFSRTPGDQTLVGCIRKVLNLRHTIDRDEKQCEPVPRLWVLSVGRPLKGLKALGAKIKRGWPRGVYEIPSGFQTGIVAISRLPKNRSTLLLRLMGRGKTLDRAVRELLKLPIDAWERQMAAPILIKYHVMAEQKPDLSPEEEAYLKAIEPIRREWDERIEKNNAAFTAALDRGFEEGRKDGLAEGRKDGLAEGRKDGFQAGHRGALLDVYSARFGKIPAALRHAVEQAHDESTLRSWIPVVATGTQQDIARTLLQGLA